MTTTTRIMIVWALMSITAARASAETPASNAEHMQQLSWLVGDWTATVKAEDDIPGVVEKGGELQMEFSCEWGLNKNVVRTAWTIKKGDVKLLAHAGMLAWDAQKKLVVSAGADTNGKFVAGRWTKSGEKWQLRSVASSPKAATKAKHVISEIQADQFSFETVESVRDGEPQDLNGPVIFKRVK